MLKFQVKFLLQDLGSHETNSYRAVYSWIKISENYVNKNHINQRNYLKQLFSKSKKSNTSVFQIVRLLHFILIDFR